MSAAYPSGSNTFVKDHQATGGLVVDFSRNVEDFALNRYVQIRPVRKESGYYLEMTVEEAGRVLHSDLADFVWPDGQDRPSHPDGTESFRFREYRTERFDYGFVLGDKAIDQADWDVLESHGRIKAQQAMTARTQRAVAAMTNAAAYDASHVADVADIDGATGAWSDSTVETQDVRRSLAFAASLIRMDTLGVVKTRDLRLVLGPDVARKIALAPEIVEYVAHSERATAQVRGLAPGRNADYGLPDYLYGVEVVVEDAVKVTSRKGAASVQRTYLMPDDVAVLVSRPGDLVSPGGGPTFSTLMLLAYEEMAVETLYDQRNRRTEGHVVDDLALVMTAPATGFLFQGVTTSGA